MYITVHISFRNVCLIFTKKIFEFDYISGDYGDFIMRLALDLESVLFVTINRFNKTQL